MVLRSTRSGVSHFYSHFDRLLISDDRWREAFGDISELANRTHSRGVLVLLCSYLAMAAENRVPCPGNPTSMP